MKQFCRVENPEGENANVLIVSPDGYVRVTKKLFATLSLAHFLSGLDDEPAKAPGACGGQGTVSGYTEWLSASLPAVSIGWDWDLKVTGGGVQYVRRGWPRSNLMFINAENGFDLGDEMTGFCINVWIDQSGWEACIDKSIRLRYA